MKSLAAQLNRISRKFELAKAIRYALTRTRKLRPYLDHGFLEIDNNFAERAIKPIVIGGKNDPAGGPPMAKPPARALAEMRRVDESNMNHSDDGGY